MREQFEVVTRLFSDPSTQLEAKTKGDQGEQQPDKKKRYRRLAFIAITVVIAFFDVITDWYNWYEFKTYAESLEEDDLSDDYNLNGYSHSLLIISALGTIWFLFEGISAFLRFKRIRKGKQLTHQSVALESCISLMVSLTEDFPTSAIFFSALMRPVCPVLEQALSLSGRLTLITAGLSALWKLMLVCCCCCCCGCRNEDEEKCKATCAWCCKCCIRTVRIPVQLATVIFIIIIFASARKPGLTKDTQKDGYLVLYHRVSDVEYRPPIHGDRCEEFSIQTELNVKLSQLQRAPKEGMWMKIKCDQVTPYYSYLGPRDPFNLTNADCDVIVHLKFNKVYARVIYQVFMETSSLAGSSNNVDLTYLKESRPASFNQILIPQAEQQLCDGGNCFSQTPGGAVSATLTVDLLGNVYTVCKVTVHRREQSADPSPWPGVIPAYDAKYSFKPCPD